MPEHIGQNDIHRALTQSADRLASGPPSPTDFPPITRFIPRTALPVTPESGCDRCPPLLPPFRSRKRTAGQFLRLAPETGARGLISPVLAGPAPAVAEHAPVLERPDRSIKRRPRARSKGLRRLPGPRSRPRVRAPADRGEGPARLPASCPAPCPGTRPEPCPSATSSSSAIPARRSGSATPASASRSRPGLRGGAHT